MMITKDLLGKIALNENKRSISKYTVLMLICLRLRVLLGLVRRDEARPVALDHHRWRH